MKLETGEKESRKVIKLIPSENICVLKFSCGFETLLESLRIKLSRSLKELARKGVCNRREIKYGENNYSVRILHEHIL